MLDLYVELRRIVEALDADIDLLIFRDDVGRVARALEPGGFRPAGRAMPVAGGRLWTSFSRSTRRSCPS